MSKGVLLALKEGNMENIDIVADIVDPPPITLGKNRFEVDQENAKIRIWNKETVCVGGKRYDPRQHGDRRFCVYGPLS
jgi:hypothetical protein